MLGSQGITSPRCAGDAVEYHIHRRALQGATVPFFVRYNDFGNHLRSQSATDNDAGRIATKKRGYDAKRRPSRCESRGAVRGAKQAPRAALSGGGSFGRECRRQLRRVSSVSPT